MPNSEESNSNYYVIQTWLDGSNTRSMRFDVCRRCGLVVGGMCAHDRFHQNLDSVMGSLDQLLAEKLPGE